jgi:hypothetical protein
MFGATRDFDREFDGVFDGVSTTPGTRRAQPRPPIRCLA